MGQVFGKIIRELVIYIISILCSKNGRNSKEDEALIWNYVVEQKDVLGAVVHPKKEDIWIKHYCTSLDSKNEDHDQPSRSEEFLQSLSDASLRLVSTNEIIDEKKLLIEIPDAHSDMVSIIPRENDNGIKGSHDQNSQSSLVSSDEALKLADNVADQKEDVGGQPKKKNKRASRKKKIITIPSEYEDEDEDHDQPIRTEKFLQSSSDASLRRLVSTNEIVDEKNLIIEIPNAHSHMVSSIPRENDNGIKGSHDQNSQSSLVSTDEALKLADNVADQKEDVGGQPKKKNKRASRKKKIKDKWIKHYHSSQKILLVGKKKNMRASRKKKKDKWIKHYCSSQKILLVGEGDFSFSASLGKAFGSASNMIATSLDSESKLKENYEDAMSNINHLKENGCTVLHDVDATEMASHSGLNGLKFDRIIYNFPLVGFLNESAKRTQLRRNRNLVLKFMKNAKELIKEDGEIHITHKSSGFYREWNLEGLAKQNRLKLIEEVEFKLWHYPGYNYKYGFGEDGNFNCYPSKTYKFGLRDVVAALHLVNDGEVQKEDVGGQPIAKNKNKLASGKKKKKDKWIKHYCSSQKILLVGEGDFSFSACLAKAFGSASNMIATSLDSKTFLKKNYAKAMPNINYLKNKGCTVIHNMDATEMVNHPSLYGLTVDRIVFNFPLVGFFDTYSQKNQLKFNQSLVRSFMQNAVEMIEEDGEIHITHKSNGFFKKWNLPNLARESGLNLVEDEQFDLNEYPGYNNKFGFGGDDNFNCYPSKTYKFGL